MQGCLVTTGFCLCAPYIGAQDIACSKICVLQAWEVDSFCATLTIQQKLQQVQDGICAAKTGVKTDQPNNNTIGFAAWYMCA